MRATKWMYRRFRKRIAQDGCDMLVNLTHLPPCEPCGDVRIKRAFPGDRDEILAFIRTRFSNAHWAAEAEHALWQEPSKLFIATEHGRLLGFACYDSSAKGFFGPTGVCRAARGRGIGKALLLHTLAAMRADGYGYAIIGWVTDAAPFYEKTVGAVRIPGASPENSVYSDMVFME